MERIGRIFMDFLKIRQIRDPAKLDVKNRNVHSMRFSAGPANELR